jgi:putative nucleotidyltransferase with HDIG domain
MDLDAALAARVKKGTIRVPPSPVVALRMMQLLGDEKTPLKTLVATLAQDQSLAAIVLRLANSAHYRRGAEVVALPQAVMVLGRTALREVSVAKELHERTIGSGLLVALRRRAWRESLACAQVATWVAPWFSVAPDEAFVAGLLHDIGRVPAIGILEQLLTEYPDADTRSEDGWWDAVEQHHVVLGALLARSWGLPVAVASVITGHHDVAQTEPMFEVLRIADQVVQLMDGEPYVAAEKLGVIAALSTSQCEELAAQLPLIPQTLDAFRETSVDEKAGVIDYELHLPDALDHAPQVGLICEGLVIEADLRSATTDALIVEAEFRIGKLVKVRAGDARFHARVSSSGLGCVELRPWALDDAQRAEWQRFVDAQLVTKAA